MEHTPEPPNTSRPDPSPSSAPTAPAQVEPLAGRRPTEPPVAAFPGYEFVRELGRGGMGVVYLARNRLLDRLEAVKVLARPWSEDRFRQEVRASARLRHPNVVTVYSALVSEGCLAFAMEYVEGENLGRLVRTGGPLPPRLACAYAHQAALGLQHAHERGTTHRDVKPQNMMLCRADERDTVKILDFGLAKLAAAEPDDSVTIAGELVGTPGYAAPEQLRDAGTADVRSDVYGLGVSLWFLLTGNQPSKDNPLGDAPGPADRSGWPDGLVEVLARMTAWNPADRYQTPAEVAVALEPFAAERAPTAGRRSRRWAAVAAVGLLVSALCAATLARTDEPAPDVPAPAPPPRPAGAFVCAFNGTDLAGWVVDGPSDQWRVEDGAITTTGTRDGPRSWLLSARDYGDVRVRFEYQFEPGANTGFAFRAVPGERPILQSRGVPTPTAYHQQVELSDDAHREWRWIPTGQINGGVGKDAASLKPVRPAQPRLAPDWNTAEIELVGQSLTLTVNGAPIQAADLNQLVASGSRYPALTRTRGRLGFQQHARTVRFRHIEVLELPSRSGDL